MDMLNATNARKQFYSLMQNVNTSHRPIYITGKSGNAVLISEDDWRAIEETLHLQAVPGLVDNIKSSEKENLDEMINADELEW